MLPAVITHMLLHLIFFFTFAFCEDLCSRYQWGTFCNNDLSAYRKCAGWNWIQTNKFSQVLEVKCPEGTRCSCFLGNDCFGFLQLEEKDICQPYVDAYPLVDVLHLKYLTYGWRQLDTFNHQNEEFSKKGEIRQDLSKNSKLHTWEEFNKTHFELIIPDRLDNFQKYTGTYSGTCKKTEVPTFVPFGGDIKYYTQGNTKKTYKSFEIQTWYTNVYHQEGLGLVKNWTVIAETSSKRIVPIVFESSYTATQENQCCDYFERTKYQQMKSKDTEDWFEVPTICQ